MKCHSAMASLRVTTSVAAWAIFSLLACDAYPARPNLVVVLIDDLGWGDFSCYGNRKTQTPAVDQMATEGRRFNRFYVNSPVCSPSRTAITTGQYPQRWRIGSYLDSRANNDRRGVANWLDPKAPTLARCLHEQGYATGHFGKWHLGGQRDVGDAPAISQYGYDQSLTNFEGLGPRVLPLFYHEAGKPPVRKALGSDQLGHGPIQWLDRSRITTAYVDAAIRFMDNAKDKSQPFYVNVWPDDVHTPLNPPLAERGNGAKDQLYQGVLAAMDRQLAPLFAHIRQDPALRDNTLVVICSDNGPEPGAGAAGPLRGGKASLYEGGIRSPLITWGLGKRRNGGVADDTSVLAGFDLAPSLLRIAGIHLAEAIPFDGEDVSSCLLGNSPHTRKSPVFWRRPPDRKTWPPLVTEPQPDLAVCDGNWKLVCDYSGENPELYQLADDIGESHNLASQHPEKVAQLTKALLAWHQMMPADQGPELAIPAK